MNISIHFLYTEEDLQNIDSASVIINFNPLPLYRGRQIIHKISTIITYFNPLPLYRGRLRCGQKENTWKNYFNPLPLYRGRQKRDVFILWLKLYFNPLPLYRGRLDGGFYRRRAQIFQSTSSIQRKTAKRRLPRRLPWYFNPLPLYRGRPQISTNEYPSSRHFISNFDIKAIILSTRFSKLSYV